jgi:enoyl-CoA hydratase/carnithine racemase
VKQIGKKLHSFSDARYVHIHIDRYTHSLRNALYAVTHTHIDRYIHTHTDTHLVLSFLEAHTFAMMMMTKCETLEVYRDAAAKYAVVSLNRPHKLNAINSQMWREIPLVFDQLSEDASINAIVLTGKGKHFCAGIDVSSKETLFETLGDTMETVADVGRRGEYLLRHIKRLQASVTSVERCRKPVVCMIKGACVGGGLDIAAACDVRFCDASAFFSVKEVELGIVADIGSLQRLPPIVGHGRAAEMALTARTVNGEEAEKMGLVSKCFSDDEELERACVEVAKRMAGLSPLAVQGTKRSLLNSRDSESVEKGLEYVALKNAAQL